MTYAFTFDASSCSGCKACQAACKDKNQLPTGVLWRRVFEIAGGTWQQNGEAWNNTVFAYNLSIACNHCMHPKCAGVCPTGAYMIREDGIVLLDTTKCMGCGYCAWACPYGAPQYNPEAGSMTKCNFCYDQLDQGLPPVCVAACPLRALNYGDISNEHTLSGNEIRLWEVASDEHPYPLPSYSHTQPRLSIKPHAGMARTEKKSVTNFEEVQPRRPSAWEDVPLILFTLLAQIAVGSFWAMAWIFSPLWSLVEYDTTFLQLLPSLLVGLSLGAGMIASFAHLGTKKNAWRIFARWRKSSLSREVMFAGLFGLAWLLTTYEIAIWHRSAFEWIAITSMLGIGLIYNMSQVYRFPAAPGWNTWRTNASFFVSALLLGQSTMTVLLAYESNLTGIQMFASQWAQISGGMILLLLAQLGLMRQRDTYQRLQTIRVGLILGGVMVSVISLFLSRLDLTGLSLFLFLIVACEETIGRWLFYQSRT